MILITGATGKIGGAVIQQLLTQTPAANIAALVRDPAKAAGLEASGVRIRVGDYDDTASLQQAMQGVDKVLLVSGGGAEHGLQQHRNVVDAAKEAGVQCIAYTSRSLNNRDTLANKLMVRHFETEDYIKESGLNYIFFRNILYMDVLPLYVGENVLEEGSFQWPAGDGKVSYALRSEMGEAIANVLLQDTCNNATYHFTGTKQYSFEDVASTLSKLSGKTVRFVPVTPAVFRERMAQKGHPPFLIQLMTDFAIDIAAGQESNISNDLEAQLGRRPSSLEEGLKAMFHL